MREISPNQPWTLAQKLLFISAVAVGAWIIVSGAYLGAVEIARMVGGAA